MKFELRWFLLVLLGAGTTATSGAEAALDSDGSTHSLSIEWVVSEVLSNNPSLKAARASWVAMKSRVRQARAWEDPRVGVDVERSGTTRFDTLTDAEWMAGQELPLSGKNRWRGRVAAAEAEVALADVRRLELDLAARARSACYRLANAHVQLELNRRNEAVLQRFVEVSRLKYESGTRSQADVLMAETELGKLLEARRDIERQIVEEQSGINVLMNRPPQAPLGPPTLVLAPHRDLSPDRLRAMALEHRPEILGIRQRIVAAKARRTLARRAWVPDPELRVEARQFNGAGGDIQEYDTGIFFSFPWINRGKYKAAIEEAEKMQESAELDLEAIEAETLGMVRSQIERVETLHHHYTLFHDRLVPLAQQAVQASEIAYTNERGSLLELLTAQRTARETESALHDHRTEYLSAMAELQRMVGTRLEAAGIPQSKPQENP